MVLCPIEHCRTSSFFPRRVDLLKELHPKELIELPDIFAGIVIPFICLYLQYSKLMVILSVNSHYVKDDVVPPLHVIRFLYSLLFVFVVVIILKRKTYAYYVKSLKWKDVARK